MAGIVHGAGFSVDSRYRSDTHTYKKPDVRREERPVFVLESIGVVLEIYKDK